MGQGENLSSKESKSETHRQLVLVLVTGSDLYFSSVYLYFIMVMDRNFTFYSEKQAEKLKSCEMKDEG